MVSMELIAIAILFVEFVYICVNVERICWSELSIANVSLCRWNWCLFPFEAKTLSHVFIISLESRPFH